MSYNKFVSRNYKINLRFVFCQIRYFKLTSSLKLTSTPSQSYIPTRESCQFGYTQPCVSQSLLYVYHSHSCMCITVTPMCRDISNHVSHAFVLFRLCVPFESHMIVVDWTMDIHVYPMSQRGHKRGHKRGHQTCDITGWHHCLYVVCTLYVRLFLSIEVCILHITHI